MYSIFKTCCTISALFHIIYHLVHNFIFVQIVFTFYIKHALKFKYSPNCVKVYDTWYLTA